MSMKILTRWKYRKYRRDLLKRKPTLEDFKNLFKEKENENNQTQMD